MSHILDRPVWSTLATRHSHLAEGGELARRFQPSISFFASARDDSSECLEALGNLARPGDTLLVVQSDEIVVPSGLVATTTGHLVQMIAERPFAKVRDERVERLSDSDAEEMLALATLTKPGPFSLKAQSLGEFWGVRVDGKLVAMAGERMKQPGYSELSGVCSHPDFRGGGLARLLSVFVAGRIAERGETAYLHAWATNSGAIALYESIGFGLRRRMNVAALERRD